MLNPCRLYCCGARDPEDIMIMVIIIIIILLIYYVLCVCLYVYLCIDKSLHPYHRLLFIVVVDVVVLFRFHYSPFSHHLSRSIPRSRLYNYCYYHNIIIIIIIYYYYYYEYTIRQTVYHAYSPAATTTNCMWTPCASRTEGKK